MKHRVVPTALVAVALGLGLVPASQAHDRHKDHAARFEQHMQEAAQRLGLTESQKQQLQPIVEEHVAKAKALREKYPAETAHEQKRQMRDEMHAIRQDYDAKVRAVLDEKQRQEWDRMRAERHDRMRGHAKEPDHDREAT
jgi:uncharacterized protein HemX